MYKMLMCIVSLPLTFNSIEFFFHSGNLDSSDFSVVTMDKTRHGRVLSSRTCPCFGVPITRTTESSSLTAGPPTAICAYASSSRRGHIRKYGYYTMDAPISGTTRSRSLTEGMPAPFGYSLLDYGPFQYRRETTPSRRTVV